MLGTRRDGRPLTRPKARRFVTSVLLALVLIAAGAVLRAADASGRRSLPDGCKVAAGPTGPVRQRGLGSGTDGNPPEGWTEAGTRPFDWNDDGDADQLDIDAAGHSVTVRWRDGSITVDDVSMPVVEKTSGTPAPRPAAVADVTGDGWPDLIVVRHGEVRVLVGPGSAIDSRRTVPFAAVGSTERGWVSPPTSTEGQPQIPYDNASVRPMWDLDGDGADDFSVVSHARRAPGPIARYLGRPCAGLTAADRLSHRAGMPHPEAIAGDGRATTRDVATTSGTGTVSTTWIPPTTVPPPPKNGRPTVLGVDTPDPAVLRVGHTYRVYTTNTFVLNGLLNVPVRRSNMLWDWDAPNDALPNVGSWSDGNKSGDVWAPSVRAFGATYVLYYVAPVRDGLGADNRQCIGRATSTNPDGPFVDNNPLPIVCQSLFGGSIDPHVYVDGGGVPWLTFKNDGNCCGMPVGIWSMQLTADGLNVVGSAHGLFNADRPWEGGLVENSAMVSANGTNWLFYSGNTWSSASYATGYGWCWQASGPCTKTTTDTPWLATPNTDYAQGPGGADLFQDPNGGWWIVYHGWINGVGYDAGGVRALFIDKVDFSTGSPVIKSDVPYETVLPPPPAVTGLSLTQTGHDLVKATWSPVTADPPLTGFELTATDVQQQQFPCTSFAAGPTATEASVPCVQDNHTYDVTIRARNAGQYGPTSTPVRITLADYGTRFVGVTPARVLDTRDGTGQPGNVPAKVGAGQSLTLSLADRGGLPAAGQFSAAVLNLTVVNPSQKSHLRVYPGDATDPPLASSLNFDPGITIAAAVTVQAAPNGTVKIYNNSGETQVIADVVGYYTAPAADSGALHRSVAPARVLDTRSGQGLEGNVPARVGAQQSISLSLAGQAGLPEAGAFSSVILNVTAVNGSQASHLRVYPGDQASPPFASSVNFSAGQNIANLVTVRAAADGTVKLYNQSGDVDIVADVVGYYGPLGGTQGAKFYATPPNRLTDTRWWPPESGMSPLPAGTPLYVGIYGSFGYFQEPMSAAVLTVTVDQPSAPSHLTVWPADLAMPTASNLNFVAGQVIANQASVQVSQPTPQCQYCGHAVKVQNNAGTVQVIVDLNGWFGAEAT